MRDFPEDIEEELFDFNVDIDIDDDTLNLSEEDLSELNRFNTDTQGLSSAKTPQRERRSIRYVRTDITASLSQADIFGSYTLFSLSRSITVKLLDISTKGAFIASPKKMRLNKKLILTLLFHENKKFEISAKIVRKADTEQLLYGLEFNTANNELGEYLLDSQTKLVFK